MKRAFVLGVAAFIIAVGAETILASVQRERPQHPKLSPERAELEPPQIIPTGYKTYSLFLVCNPQWLEPRKGESSDLDDNLRQIFDLNDLYQKFDSFGRTIGDDNLAVWLSHRSGRKMRDEDLVGPVSGRKVRSSDVDVERSVRFCKAWGLRPSAGPHIVVTSTYPDEFGLTERPKDSAVFELGNMESAQISKLLVKLTDDLIEKGHVDNQRNAQEARWVRLLEAAQQSINKFGCAWSFKIDAGPVKADLHSCKS